MRKTDLAYAAGIIDGEGCIGISFHRQVRPNKSYTFYELQVRVNHTNEWLCQWLRFAFGGHVSPRNSQSMKRNTWKPQWAWEIAARRALVFLELIYPYLRLKKPQAEIAIRFQRAKHHQGRKKMSTEAELAIIEAQKILISSLNQGK